MENEEFLKLLHEEHKSRKIKFFPLEKKKYIDVEFQDLNKIVRIIIDYYNYSYRAIIGRKRGETKTHAHNVVEVRHMIAFVANAWFGIGIIKIMKKLNYKDHSSVQKGRDKIALLINEEDFDCMAHLRNIKMELLKKGMSCG